MSALSEFIHSTISFEHVPINPIRRVGWAGLAFDRNFYENLAPADVWNAVFDVHKRTGPEAQVWGITVAELDANQRPRLIAPSADALHDYLLEETRFLCDGYLYSDAHNWLVRLDMDVTIFAGEQEFMQDVVRRAGGLPAVMARMTEDFEPGEGDPVGLGAFLRSLTAPLRT